MLRSLFIILIFANIGKAQTKLDVSFEGVSDDNFIKITSTKKISDSAVIINSRSTFLLGNILLNNYELLFISCHAKSKYFQFPILIRKNSNAIVSIDQSLKKIEIAGDDFLYKEQNDYYKNYGKLYNLYTQFKDTLVSKKYNDDSINLQNEYKLITNEYLNYPLKWVGNHSESPFSPAVIRLFIDKSNSLKKIDSLSLKCYESLDPIAKLDNSESEILQKTYAYYDEKYALFPVGSVPPNFKLIDAKGKSISLNSFANKWVLLDFWSSYCGPCRVNNSRLKELYNKYKYTNFTIISISADIDKAKWHQAIKDDNMEWNQISDLKGISQGILHDYRINALPTYFLISPDGKIAAHSIGGDIELIGKVIDKTLKK